MKCPNCGKEIANDSQFCEFCGAKIGKEMKVTPTASMTIQQIVLIFAFLAYCVFAIVMMNRSTSEYIDKSFSRQMYIFSIIGACVLIGSIWLKSILDKKPFQMRQPNGVKPDSLGSFLGIGQVLMGGFKYRKYEDTYVVYRFFFFILPLFPTGCYRGQLLKSEGGMSYNKQEWAIYGSEESDGLEILNIYLITIGAIVWAGCAIMALIF